MQNLGLVNEVKHPEQSRFYVKLPLAYLTACPHSAFPPGEREHHCLFLSHPVLHTCPTHQTQALAPLQLAFSAKNCLGRYERCSLLLRDFSAGNLHIWLHCLCDATLPPSTMVINPFRVVIRRPPALTAGQDSYVVGSEAQLYSTQNPGLLHLPAQIAIILISFGRFLRLVLLCGS